jgi:hypothetical protein
MTPVTEIHCDIQKCKLAVKILTNIDNEEWREKILSRVSISVTGVIYCALQCGNPTLLHSSSET